MDTWHKIQVSLRTTTFF